MKDSQIFVCGGGTGGHYFSGIALAESFLKLYPQYQVTFIGTRNGIEGRTTLSDSRMRIFYISAKGLKGKGLLSKCLGLFYFKIGFFQSCWILLRERPKVVFGVGGYASAPTLMAALCLKWVGSWRISVLEQNSTPGLVNRILSRFSILALSAFDSPGFRTIDLPLRSSTLEKAKNLRIFNWPPKVIFILGGSQGAKGLNNRWKEMFPKILVNFPKISVIHQTGREQEIEFKDFYRSLNVDAHVFAFSNEIPKYYDQSDLLICRSGAMTVFEVMTFRRPCIFVPFPAAADDHQFRNARAVQASDWVIREDDFTSDSVMPLLSTDKPQVPSRPLSGESWEGVFAQLLERARTSRGLTSKS